MHVIIDLSNYLIILQKHLHLFYIGFSFIRLPKNSLEMLSAAQNNSLTKALVQQHAAEINAVDVMRYSAQRMILTILIHRAMAGLH